VGQTGVGENAETVMDNQTASREFAVVNRTAMERNVATMGAGKCAVNVAVTICALKASARNVAMVMRYRGMAAPMGR